MDDLTNQRFGRLAVIKFIGRSKRYEQLYLCRCDCGNEVIVKRKGLLKGETKSCGCLRKEIAKELNTKHGKSNTKLYEVWKGIKARCYNPTHIGYGNYGGRGIKVCDEWLNDFGSFFNWSIDNGYCDGYQIDRIDNEGDYEPDNCRWVTAKENSNNKRTNHLITYKGETKTMREWCDELGFNYYTIRSRINNYHWSVEKAFETPTK